MSGQDVNLLDAIQLAREMEQKASAYYADASAVTANPIGKQLFEQLSEFEMGHERALAALETSLRNQSTYAGYSGQKALTPSRGEVDKIAEPDKMSVMNIISLAMDTERQAEKRYLSLANQAAQKEEVHALFMRLAKEEHLHYRILGEAYWSLNERGVWDFKL